MEELTVDNFSISSSFSDNEYNFSSDNSPDSQECSKDDDNRIACSNSHNLDLIMRIVASHVTKLAGSLDLKEEQSQFASRVLQIFKDNIQENVTINGLPYDGDKNFLTPVNNEVLTNETKEALLANLSKKTQGVCDKRKKCPKEFTRIYKMKLHHNYQNIKKLRVTHNVKLPSVSKGSFHLDSLSPQKLEETGMQIKSTQRNLISALKELKDMENNIQYAQNIVAKQESLCDTGYISS